MVKISENFFTHCRTLGKLSVRVWGGQGYPNKHHEHFKVIFSITREEIELPVKISDKILNLTRPSGYAYKIMSWQISDFVGVLNFVKSKKAIVERPRQPRANY